MIREARDKKNVAPLFLGWEETLIWSCLQGVMGNIYTDDADHPSSAMAALGDFSFFAGRPDEALAAYKPLSCHSDYMIMVPQNEEWEEVILKIYGKRAKIISRYATKKEPAVWDIKALKEMVSFLPEGYEIRMIDGPLFRMCKAEAWSADLVSLYPNYSVYRELGLGAVVCKDHMIVSGASSYSRYLEGIEIEIDTREEYRRRGFAGLCGAKLILECLKRNLYPSWDAHDKRSLALAEKLGYHYSHTYTAIEIEGY